MPTDKTSSPSVPEPPPESGEEIPNLSIEPPPLTWLQKSYYTGKSGSDGSGTTGSRKP